MRHTLSASSRYAASGSGEKSSIIRVEHAMIVSLSVSDVLSTRLTYVCERDRE